jgi:hypothetical protein
VTQTGEEEGGAATRLGWQLRGIRRPARWCWAAAAPSFGGATAADNPRGGYSGQEVYARCLAPRDMSGHPARPTGGRRRSAARLTRGPMRKDFPDFK